MTSAEKISAAMAVADRHVRVDGGALPVDICMALDEAGLNPDEVEQELLEKYGDD
jgi:hypothetical protein